MINHGASRLQTLSTRLIPPPLDPAGRRRKRLDQPLFNRLRGEKVAEKWRSTHFMDAEILASFIYKKHNTNYL